MNPTCPSFPLPPRHRQSGLALLVALIALVAMSLAGIALIRSVDTNVLVASNMAFRITARESTDAGIETARTWLTTRRSENLPNDLSDSGYYAARGAGVDLTSNTGNAGDIKAVDWKNNNGDSTGGDIKPACLSGTDAANSVVCYVIQRMCDRTGAFTNDDITLVNTCDTVIIASNGQSCNHRKGCPDPNDARGIVYRVTVRAARLRNNFSSVQAFIVLPGPSSSDLGGDPNSGASGNSP
jgi:Tfp pilus assembly protein PilX